MEYLHNKDLSYFEDYNTNYKLTPHVYVAEGLEEIQENLQELNHTYEPYQSSHTLDKLIKLYKLSCWSMKQLAKNNRKLTFFNKMIYCINQLISFATKSHDLNEFWQYQVISQTFT